MKKLAIRCGIASAILAIAVLAFFQIENYRGRAAWERYQAEVVELGETLELADILGPEIPESENFAAIPFFQEVLAGGDVGQAAKDRVKLTVGRETQKKPPFSKLYSGIPIQLKAWKEYLGVEDLRAFLAGYEPVLNQIAEAGGRPKTRFPMSYEDGVLGLKFDHSVPLLNLASLLALRAELSLSEGKTEEAAKDVILILRLAEAAGSEPTLVSSLVESAIAFQALSVIWDGTAMHQWESSKLREIRAALQKIKLFSNMARAFRGERAIAVREWELIRAHPKERISAYVVDEEGKETIRWIARGPLGWLYQNQVTQARFYQKMIDALEKRPIGFGEFVFSPENPKWYHGWMDLSARSTITIAERIVNHQTRINQAIIATALEEYRIDHGAYPPTLDALVPSLLKELPVDLIAEEPFVYRTTGEGSYLLYSVGWNVKDDGGKVVLKDEMQLDETQGDWVWFGSPQTTTKKE